MDELKRLWVEYSWLEYSDNNSPTTKVVRYSVGMLLGYPVKVDTTATTYQITPSNHNEYFDLCQEIVEVKTLLSQALRDSMAKEVGELVLDMGTYISNLKHTGSAKLALLSQYTGIPLAVDMFTGRIHTTHTTPYSLKALY